MGSECLTAPTDKLNLHFILSQNNLTMLERPGDLIPVLPNAVTIPWTRRRSQILNYLHRGPVTFNTLVYDTNVGDISALATYFNPDKRSGAEAAVKPRLLLYPDHSQEKVQRTYNWVMSQDSKAGSPVPVIQGQQRQNLTTTTSSLDMGPPQLNVNRNFSNPLLSKPFTMPSTAISSVLDNVWSDKGTESPDSSWPDKLSETGFGLGELACRLNRSTAEGEMSAWESGPQPFR